MGKRARVIGSTAETARKRPERPWTAARTMEMLRRCPLAIAQRLVHCAIALSTAVLDRVTKTMSVAPLLTNNLDNSKQKMSNLLSPAPPPYSWSLLGKSEGPAPPPSSKISWSFDLAWNPVVCFLTTRFYRSDRPIYLQNKCQLCVSVSVSVCLYVSVCLSVCLSVHVYIYLSLFGGGGGRGISTSVLLETNREKVT